MTQTAETTPPRVERGGGRFTRRTWSLKLEGEIEAFHGAPPFDCEESIRLLLSNCSTLRGVWQAAALKRWGFWRGRCWVRAYSKRRAERVVSVRLHHNQCFRRASTMSTQSTTKLCGFQGCGRPLKSFGYCDAHYRQQRRGETLQPLKQDQPKKFCTFPGCAKPHSSSGLCTTHSAQQRRGIQLKPIRRRIPGSLCTFPQCDKPHSAGGYCDAHHKQFVAGNELKPLRRWMTNPTIICDEVPCSNPELIGPCHVWRGKTNSGGYAFISWKGVHISVHRYIWIQEYGPIPESDVPLEIDHQCKNRACSNVDHLRLVTKKINMTENISGTGWQLNAAKTHCKHGHEFTEENTIRSKDRRRRWCRTCSLGIKRRSKAANKKPKPNDASLLWE